MTRIPEVNQLKLFMGMTRHFVHFLSMLLMGTIGRIDVTGQLGRNVWFPSIICPSLHPAENDALEGKSKMPLLKG